MLSLTSPSSHWIASFRASSGLSGPLLPKSCKFSSPIFFRDEISSLHCNLFFSVERSSPNTSIYPTIQANASNSGSSRKSKSSAKPVSKKKESPWKDESAVTTIASNLSRKPSSGGRGGSSSNERTRTENETLGTQHPSRHASDHGSIVKAGKKKGGTSRVIVSAAMPVETEVVLQTQEPSVTPSWNTFASSHCGVWRGIGAAFSPMNAEMEPIFLGDVNEYLYDCRIYSTVEEVQGTNGSSIQRKTFWAVGNPYGEQGKKELMVQQLPADEMENEDGPCKDVEEDFIGNSGGLDNTVGDILVSKGEDTSNAENKEVSYGSVMEADLIDLEAGPADTQEERVTADLDSKELSYSSVMEEDAMELEPGLIFFEDGSYSRGPLELLTGDVTLFEFGSTYKIEQCLVRGGHTRLRLVHTIGVEEEREEIELLRVAVYEEEWMGPCYVKSISDTGGHHLSLFSTRERTLQQELAGSWKVFEVSATAVLPEESVTGALTDRPPYVYLNMETVKRRLLPDKPVQFVDEDILDMQDVTVLWLPGGITAYMDQKEDGVLTIGVGWYSDGVNLVMERDYNANGRLNEVRTKSEVKGGWVGGRM